MASGSMDPMPPAEESTPAHLACTRCTFVNRAEASRCTMCDAPLTKKPRMSEPEQVAPSSEVKLSQAKSDARASSTKEAVVCGWKKDNGTICDYHGRADNVRSHQATVSYHSRARSALQQKEGMANLFGMKQPSTVASNHETKPMTAAPADVLPSVQEGTILSGLAGVLHAFGELKLGMDGVVESMRSMMHSQEMVSRTVREERIAEAVVRRIKEKEREDLKTEEEKAAEAAKSRLEKQLDACKSVRELCACVGVFNYSEGEEIIFCTICTPFISSPVAELRIPSDVVGHFNYARFGTISASFCAAGGSYNEKRLKIMKKDIKGHLETKGHHYCVENKAAYDAKANAKRTAGLNVAATAYECLLEARSAEVCPPSPLTLLPPKCIAPSPCATQDTIYTEHYGFTSLCAWLNAQ